jgi:hypothetical protein
MPADSLVPDEARAGRLGTAFDLRLAQYLTAAAGVGAVFASEADALIVSNTTPQPIGINGEVNIDFNSDGQTDVQIDHDRVNLAGNNIDYLQVDKNDVSSATNPLPIDNFVTFPTNGTPANGDLQYLGFTNSFGDAGGYAVALKPGDLIGTAGIDNGAGLIAGTRFDFQEGSSFLGPNGPTIRANRLIDEDRGQIDTALNPSEPVQLPFGMQPEFPDIDDWVGLGGATRYVGVRLDLNDRIFPGLNNNDNAAQFVHGWIGVQITNEADATGVITGWAYQTTPGMSIAAGDVGTPILNPGDFSGDGRVDGGDLSLLLSNWGGAVPPSPSGWNGAAPTASAIDSDELSRLLANWGFGTATAVPEPSAAVTALVAGAAMVWGGVRRRTVRVHRA